MADRISSARLGVALGGAIVAAAAALLLLRVRAGVGESLEGSVVANGAAVTAGLAVAALTVAAIGRRGRRTDHE